MTVSLKSLRKLGVIPRTTKRWTKDALIAKGEYIAKFADRKIPDGLEFIKVSPRVKAMLHDVHIDTIGNRMVFPVGKNRDKVSIRETKYGVIIRATNRDGVTYDIILAENGDHIAYGKKLGATRGNTTWGTLKSSDYQLRDGTVKHGYMRDLSVLYEDPDGAINDDRYPKATRASAFHRNSEVMALIRFNKNY